MFDLGWTELLLIGVVALIVVGPKDLPVMFRTLGRMTGKLKRMAREFQDAMSEAADESGFKDAEKDFRNATSAKSLGLNKLREAADRFDKWEPGKAAAAGTAAASAAQAEPEPDEDAGDLADLADLDAPAPAPETPTKDNT